MCLGEVSDLLSQSVSKFSHLQDEMVVPPTLNPKAGATRTDLPSPDLHSLEVAGVGEQRLWEGNIRLQDGDFNHPHYQHIRLEDVGTGWNKALGENKAGGDSG